MIIDNCNIIIYTFVITSVFDVILRLLSNNFKALPNFMKYDFIKYLIPYFNYHTILSAALIAGFVGALTQLIILKLIDFPKNFRFFELITFLTITFVISGLFGFVMKFSNLFPILEKTYYRKLGTIRSMYHDGVSGLIVQLPLLILFYNI